MSNPEDDSDSENRSLRISEEIIKKSRKCRVVLQDILKHGVLNDKSGGKSNVVGVHVITSSSHQDSTQPVDNPTSSSHISPDNSATVTDTAPVAGSASSNTAGGSSLHASPPSFDMSDDEVADEMVSLCEGSMQSVEKLIIKDVTKLDVLNVLEENVVNQDNAEVMDLGNLNFLLA